MKRPGNRRPRPRSNRDGDVDLLARIASPAAAPGLERGTAIAAVGLVLTLARAAAAGPARPDATDVQTTGATPAPGRVAEASHRRPGASRAAPPAGRAARARPSRLGGARTIVDRVVAMVNDAVILHSELMRRVAPITADSSKIADPRERQRRLDKLEGPGARGDGQRGADRPGRRRGQARGRGQGGQSALEEIKKQNNLDDNQLGRGAADAGLHACPATATTSAGRSSACARSTCWSGRG